MKTKINFRGIDFDVEFSYQPYEPAETGPEAQYPGCGESIEEISSIEYEENDWSDILEDYNKEIEDLIWKSVEKWSM